MKQLLQNMRDGKTVIADVPIPQVQPGTALVRTTCSLVSAGTERMLVEFAEKSLLEKARSRPDLVRQLVDKARREGILTTLEAAFNRLDQPLSLGYSSSGVIVETGEGLHGFKPGDRVACSGGNHAVHAEYAVIPQNLLTKLPDPVDFECGAFTTIGAVALHGFRLANPQVGERVAVIGLGLLGLIAASIAQAAGCKVFGIDIDAERVTRGESMGITATTRQNAQELATIFTAGQGFDSVLICADSRSNDPIELAAAIAGVRRTIVAVGAVGLNIQRKLFYDKELNFVVSRSYGPGRYDDKYEEKGQDYPIGYVRWTEGRNFQAFLDLVADRKIDVKQLITHRFAVDNAPQAYHLITGKQEEKFLAVLIEYPQEGEKVPSGSNPWTIRLTPQETTSSPQASLKLGVLGAGNYAQMVFLPNLLKTPNVARVCITSSSGLSATHAAEKYKFETASSQESCVLNNPQVNIVTILSRHNHHARQVIEALKNGKHVYCEKPLAITQEELEEIANMLNQPGLPVLMTGFNRRFAPFSIKMKQYFQPYLEPLVINYRINAGFLPLHHWLHDPEQGGGRIIGEACHFIDYLIFMTGQIPKKVAASSLPDANRYCQDNVVLSFTFKDGSIGNISYLANGNKSFPKERVEVFSAGKIAVLDDFRSLDLIDEKRRRHFHSRLTQNKGHLDSWKAFLRAVENGEPSPIPYQEQIAAALASIMAARAVSSQGIIDIPLQ